MRRAAYRWLVCAVAYAPALQAQSEDLEALMEQSIVSTPSKSAESSSTAPATSSVITAEELRAHGLRSLNEAINYASLGMVTTSPEHAVEIGARGVLLTGDYGNHVLLLIDGVPANEPWNGTAYFERGAGVPFELIDHIEVTLGPGSVMHGAQAMLGVVNIVTKRARLPRPAPDRRGRQQRASIRRRRAAAVAAFALWLRLPPGRGLWSRLLAGRHAGGAHGAARALPSAGPVLGNRAPRMG